MKGGCLLVFTDTVPRLISAASDSDRVVLAISRLPCMQAGARLNSLKPPVAHRYLLMVR